MQNGKSLMAMTKDSGISEKDVNAVVPRYTSVFHQIASLMTFQCQNCDVITPGLLMVVLLGGYHVRISFIYIYI